jgi:pyruvate-ferredoxin/flavodoxin oxidoreductase
MPEAFATLDANEAVALVAYRLTETVAIYPITPSSPMAEFCDDWASRKRPNLWGTVPNVLEMQSEGGAAGAVHGALQTGSLTTTFTASQGLLLMIPNLYKIAGELLPFCMHVTARTLATHALSIFGDHSDVMACRQAGVAMLASNSVQEAHDFACIGHAATMESRVPVMHFFDGFRTSHEVAKIDLIPDEVLRGMIDEEWVRAFRGRALLPEHPSIRGTAQNPDVFFQAREACNPFYRAMPGIVKAAMERFAKLTGRSYGLCDYVGHPEAGRVIVAMGSGAETVEETASYLNANGEKVGLLKIRLYRPFPAEEILAAIPATARSIAVLDRTKEPGAPGDPLYLDMVTALAESRAEGRSRFECEPVVIAGRFGLSSKEFDPAMVKAVYDEMKAERPKNHFTVGINDDVSGTSLAVDPSFDIEPPDVVRAVFFGLGSDGTVGANKNSIKIIGEETANYAQGYFVYDSKKSGAMTISHLRFGPRPIAAHYLIKRANFVACHHAVFLEKFDVLGYAAEGAVFLLNSPVPVGSVWDSLPVEAQAQIIDKKLSVYVIDATRVARETGMGTRINTIMQTCFFAISGVLPREEAIGEIKKAIKKTYGRKGDSVVQQNYAAVDGTLAAMKPIEVPSAVTASCKMLPPVADDAPDFVRSVTGAILAGKGDDLPVSAFTVDGTWPTATARWEKRNIADEIPIWNPAVCIQCNKCVFVCPHAAIRAKFYEPEQLAAAPEGFRSVDFRSSEFPGQKYSIQVAPEDCTGCTLCVVVCPAKDKSNPKLKAINMTPQRPIRDREVAAYDFFLNLPDPDRAGLKAEVKSSQFMVPLFEYSGACAGCGETPYIKLMSQLFGDRAMIANATGCSSIYGGNLPTTPFAVNRNGMGPAWSNSLFEDNAEYGCGMRQAVDKHREMARELLARLATQLDVKLVESLLAVEDPSEAGIARRRAEVARLREQLRRLDSTEARRLDDLADYLTRKSVWIVGGDGWAFDIGYGGLDHVLSVGLDVNILVLDTGVYSNTGGQQSKATPLGAAAKFAASGKARPKKDLGLMAIAYGNAYVASVAMGAKDSQTVRAFAEAESFAGPSIIIAYSHCIAHGYAMELGFEQQKLAVESGAWMLYRFDPRRTEAGLNPLQLDSAPPKVALGKYMANELRFRMLEKSEPDRYRELQEAAAREVEGRVALYQKLAGNGAATKGAPAQ